MEAQKHKTTCRGKKHKNLKSGEEKRLLAAKKTTTKNMKSG